MLRFTRSIPKCPALSLNSVSSFRFKSNTSFHKETFSFSDFKNQYVKSTTQPSNRTPSTNLENSSTTKTLFEIADINAVPLGFGSNRLLQGIKQTIDQYSEHVVLTQVGSFYELYFHHATEYGPLLGLKVSFKKSTSKKLQISIPMAGFPCYQLDTYLRILSQEIKVSVAIIDQYEKSKYIDPTLLTDNMKFDRRLTRIVTPGTLINDTFINWQEDNYLLALSFCKTNIIDRNDMVGMAWVNLGIGKFHYSSVKLVDLVSEISRINPKEILVEETLKNNTIFNKDQKRYNLHELFKYFISYQKSSQDKTFDPTMFNKYQSKSDMSPLESQSVYSILKYIHTQYPELKFQLPIPQRKQFERFMKLDYGSRDSLEIFQSLRNYQSQAGTLFSIIDNTVTDSGARLLKEWINEPLLSVKEITKRQDCVYELKSSAVTQAMIKNFLLSSCDPERILQKIEVGLDNLYDLYKLGKNLEIIAQIKGEISSMSSPNLSLKSLVESLNSWNTLSNYITENINSKLILKIMENEEENEIKNDTNDVRDREIVGWLINPECTTKLKELHHQLNTLGHKNNGFEFAKIKQEIRTEETRIFADMKNRILENRHSIRENCHIIDQIDVLLSFTTISTNFNLVRPTVTDTNKNTMTIKSGRHLGVEYNLMNDNTTFIENDCNINSAKIHILSGPNMGGKSTFLRQNSIIILLAQVGCFVPAEYAKFDLVDQIFCRIGSSDDLSKGESTFSVEMKETANILNNATSKSFVIIDEIGRGTGFKDGLAIAYATLVYMSEKIGCRALFTTHFGSPLEKLIHKREAISGINNYEFYCTNLVTLDNKMYHIDRKLVPGICNNSQGITIASQTSMFFFVFLSFSGFNYYKVLSSNSFTGFPKEALEYTNEAFHDITSHQLLS